jgi:chromate transport protein ChrA
LFLQQFLALEYVTYAFVGINAAVAILIIFAGLDMIKKMKKTLLPVTLMILTLGLSILFDVLDIPFSAIYYILIGGFIGILLSLYRYHVTKKNKAILLEGLLEEEN